MSGYGNRSSLPPVVPSEGSGSGWGSFAIDGSDGGGDPLRAGKAQGLVIVADDDPGVRSALARLLRVDGFEVVQEQDGSGALESARLLRPELVILDLLMPGMDGWEVCRQLKADPETRLTPVLLLTGLGDAEDRIRGLEAGGDDFLTKPAERLELMARVKSLIRTKRYTDQLVRAESVVLSLARSIEGKDPYTEGHCERLSVISEQLGMRLGLSESDIKALGYGGILHDIGKVAVPDSILLKPGPLTREEWDVMRTHPLTGEHICRPIHSFSDVLPIIRHHHEKWDGSGYPDGLAGDAIPVTARVLSTVDVFDALVTFRPYKPALAPLDALAEMEGEVVRGWWDPDCFHALDQMVRERPDAFAPRVESASQTGADRHG